jgi:hypothetical protein
MTASPKGPTATFILAYYLRPGGLLPRPGPDGLPVLLGPFTGVELI